LNFSFHRGVFFVIDLPPVVVDGALLGAGGQAGIPNESKGHWSVSERCFVCFAPRIAQGQCSGSLRVGFGQVKMDDTQMVKDDKIKRAFARIGSIRKNLGELYEIDETIAQEYAAALSHLEQLGFDVEEFTIPQAWFYNPVIVSGPRGTRYSKSRVVKRSNFVTKVDAVLEYIELIKSE
jgi:hypothetical protein